MSHHTVTIKGKPFPLEGELPKIGEKAPEFTATAKDGRASANTEVMVRPTAAIFNTSILVTPERGWAGSRIPRGTGTRA